MGAYLFQSGYAKWFAAPRRQIHVERYQELIFLFALALAGIVLGQILRRVRRVAEDYAARRASTVPTNTRDIR